MCMCPMYRWRFEELFTDVQYWGGCYVLFRWDMAWGGGTVLGVNSWYQQLTLSQVTNGLPYWVWWVQSDILSPFLLSGEVKMCRRALIILSAVLTAGVGECVKIQRVSWPFQLGSKTHWDRQPVVDSPDCGGGEASYTWCSSDRSILAPGRLLRALISE